MKTNYEEIDLLKIKSKELTINQVAEKYGVKRENVIHAMSRRKIFTRKKKILITTPYEQRVVRSIQECADLLELSRVSITKALKGERVATLENLDIKVEVIENG